MTFFMRDGGGHQFDARLSAEDHAGKGRLPRHRCRRHHRPELHLRLDHHARQRAAGVSDRRRGRRGLHHHGRCRRDHRDPQRAVRSRADQFALLKDDRHGYGPLSAADHQRDAGESQRRTSSQAALRRQLDLGLARRAVRQRRGSGRGHPGHRQLLLGAGRNRLRSAAPEGQGATTWCRRCRSSTTSATTTGIYAGGAGRTGYVTPQSRIRTPTRRRQSPTSARPRASPQAAPPSPSPARASPAPPASRSAARRRRPSSSSTATPSRR